MSRAASAGRATFGIAGTGRVYTSPRMMKIKLDATFATNIQDA